MTHLVVTRPLEALGIVEHLFDCASSLPPGMFGVVILPGQNPLLNSMERIKVVTEIRLEFG